MIIKFSPSVSDSGHEQRRLGIVPIHTGTVPLSWSFMVLFSWCFRLSK